MYDTASPDLPMHAVAQYICVNDGAWQATPQHGAAHQCMQWQNAISTATHAGAHTPGSENEPRNIQEKQIRSRKPVLNRDETCAER